MKTKNLLLSAVIISVLFMLTACKKDKDDGGGQSNRKIKFEITGNYTGKLTVAYTTSNGGTESATINSLPWTKEITYNSTVGGIGIGGGTDVPGLGIAGQTVTVKIFPGGRAVVSGTPAITQANGIVNLPNVVYQF